MTVETTDTAPGAGPERVLDALPPVRGRAFATGWWGRGWLRALEDTALDGRLLPAGRRLARSGAVGAVVVRSGRATAVVRDRDGTGHRADVLVPRLSDAAWDRLLAEAAAEAGHLAALLDGELPSRWVEDAASAGAGLLPGIGDLEPSCACGEWDHCAHTAALSYQLGRLLDQEPPLLLLLRGRDASEVVRELRQHGAAEDGSPGHHPPGVPAWSAWARTVPPFPPAPPVPETPGAEGPDLLGVPSPAGCSAEALTFLVADSAARAAGLLVGALRPDHAGSAPERPPSRWQDAARMAATGALPDTVADRLARACGRGRADLAAAGLAWRYGEADGLAVLEGDGHQVPDPSHEVPEPGAPYHRDGRPSGDAAPPHGDRRPAEPAGRDTGSASTATEGVAWHDHASGASGAGAAAGAPDVVPDADAVLGAAWAPGDRPRLRRSGNRWTVVGEGAQLRRGGDGRWWPYRRDGGRWWPAGPSKPGPAAALSAARAWSPGGDTSARHPG